MNGESFEYPDEAGYPDGRGFLDEGTEAPVDDGRRDSADFTAVPLSDYDLQMIHEVVHKRYAAWIHGEEAVTLPYHIVGGRVVLLETTVHPKFRGKGVATEFISRVLDELSQSKAKITIYCPLVRAFVDRHQQYAHLIDQGHPGVPSDSAAVPRMASSRSGETGYVE